MPEHMTSTTPTISADDPEVRAAYNGCETLAEFGEWCARRLFGDIPATLPEVA